MTSFDEETLLAVEDEYGFGVELRLAVLDPALE